jgi:hypothetical protein
MIASQDRRIHPARQAEQLQLEMLERLPCGCVVAIQSVKPSRVMVVSIEAKGPHCAFPAHRANKVMRLGGSLDAFGYEDGDDVSI